MPRKHSSGSPFGLPLGYDRGMDNSPNRDLRDDISYGNARGFFWILIASALGCFGLLVYHPGGWPIYLVCIFVALDHLIKMKALMKRRLEEQAQRVNPLTANPEPTQLPRELQQQLDRASTDDLVRMLAESDQTARFYPALLDEMMQTSRAIKAELSRRSAPPKSDAP